MVGMVSLNVFMRYVLSLSLQWAEDIVTLFFFYLIFFSIPIAFRSESHVRIIFLLNKLPEKARDILNFIIDIIILISFILVFSMSIDAIKSIGNSPYGGLKYPMSLFYFGAAISCILMVFDYILNIYVGLKGLFQKGSP